MARNDPWLIEVKRTEAGRQPSGRSERKIAILSAGAWDFMRMHMIGCALAPFLLVLLSAWMPLGDAGRRGVESEMRLRLRFEDPDSPPLRNSVDLRAELIEEEDRILYRSGAPDAHHEDLEERESYKEEQSWRMLRDLLIIPRIEDAPPAHGAPRRP